MNKSILFGALTAVFLMGTFGQAFAYVYLGNVGEEGAQPNTLEETLELAKRRIDIAEANPASGSGSPIMSAESVGGAAAIAGAVFGGIAIAFFMKARTGRYVAQGRG